MSLSKENKVVIDGQTYYGGLNQPNLKFIKVNVDCWEKIFDFLSLRDILAMSQTCQRMCQIGGHYFRENFHNLSCYVSDLCLSFDENIIFGDNRIDLERNDFFRFIDTIEVGEKLEELRPISSMGLFSSLTTLFLSCVDLNKDQLQGFENIQSTIETIELNVCSIHDKSFGEFLALCPKLKSLSIKPTSSYSEIATTSLFQRTYPMLEHFECITDDMDELILFLERNPSVNSVELNADDIEKIPLNTKVQLDYLNIHILSPNDDAERLPDQLKKLRENGFFKKLRLWIDNTRYGFDGEVCMQGMISVSGLEVLYTYNYCKPVICHLTELKELHLESLCGGDDDDVVDFETMAVNLINLERLCIWGTIDQLTSFLRHSKKLKFVIYNGEYRNGHNDNALNLFDLNRVREMGGMRQKVHLGVLGKLYLATKWKADTCNYDLLEFTRGETIRKYFYCKNIRYDLEY